MEEWKTISRSTDYEVSDHGRVRRRVDSKLTRNKRIYKKGRMTKKSINSHGYVVAVLRCGMEQKQKAYKVHRLVLEAFVGECPEDKEQANHIDGIKDNNHISNLEWVTRSENVRHAFKLGLNKIEKGENHPAAKLKEKEVRLIKKLLASDSYKLKQNDPKRISQAKISEMFNVTPVMISLIYREKNWSHITI